nr:hypothetical protein [Tanacetum cinerariifolium]
EPAYLQRDGNQGEACPTDSGFIADQDRATIAKSSTLPHDSAPRVTSLAADEGKILRLKERVKVLEDRKGVAATRFRDDAPIKRRSMDEGEAGTERISDDTEEMATILTSINAATVLAGGIDDVPTGSGSIPTAGLPAADIPTGSDVVPTASPVFATATVVTPYLRRKGKEVMVESDTLKKQRLQEQIDAQVARELEERIELISDLVKYQENYAKIYKFQSQQRMSWTKKQKRDYYMTVIRNNLGWKVKDFKGMTFEEVEAKFNSVYKQMEDFIPMGSKEEAERYKRKEKIKEMMQLIPIEEVYVEALQVKHPIIDWKSASSDSQTQIDLHASGEGLSSEEGSSPCNDLLQASSGELFINGK